MAIALRTRRATRRSTCPAEVAVEVAVLADVNDQAWTDVEGRSLGNSEADEKGKSDAVYIDPGQGTNAMSSAT